MDYMSRKSLQEFTRDEFIAFVERLSDARAGTEAEDGRLVEHFNAIVPHPAGSDLLFWPEAGADDSAQGVMTAVEHHCLANDLPAFKDSPQGRA